MCVCVCIWHEDWIFSFSPRKRTARNTGQESFDHAHKASHKGSGTISRSTIDGGINEFGSSAGGHRSFHDSGGGREGLSDGININDLMQCHDRTHGQIKRMFSIWPVEGTVVSVSGGL